MKQKELVYPLEGKDFKLKFSMRVPLLFEQAARKSYFEAFGAGKTPSLTDILTLMWACFKNGGAALSLDEMADKLDNRSLQDLSAKVMQLVADNSSATPAEEEKNGLPLEGRPQA